MPTRIAYTSMSNVTISRVKKDDATTGLISAQEGFARRDLLFCAFFGGHRFILPTTGPHSLSLSLHISGASSRGGAPLPLRWNTGMRCRTHKGFLFELPYSEACENASPKIQLLKMDLCRERHRRRHDRVSSLHLWNLALQNWLTDRPRAEMDSQK